MKLFERIKNILFDEEEVELPVIKKEEPKEYVAPKPREEVLEPKHESKGVEEEINERELFESKQTFNFPAFLDEEKPKEKEEDLRRTRNLNILDYEKIRRKEKTTTLRKPEEEEHKQFKPTPVISPVYGIVNKNYDKATRVVTEEVVRKTVKTSGSVDVEEVRNKAFGTLEDQIVRTLDKPIKDFYQEEETKPIEELLINDLDDEEQIANDDIIMESRVKNNQDKLDLLDEIEQELDNVKKEPERAIPVDDTIESDLFKLIDSMYENKEDGEE